MTACVGYNYTINEPQKWIYSTSLSVDRIHEIRHKPVKIYVKTKPREKKQRHVKLRTVATNNNNKNTIVFVRIFR